MGAEQSSTKSDGQAQTATLRKTCYYELMGIERTATDDEIRKAYKKKALELHPDRNINDIENATRKFAEVQTAYEVLSDPQERAWYDSHRDAILSGDADSSGGAESQAGGHYNNIRITTTEELYTLMGRFNSSIPFNDSPSGFFAILDVMFGRLADEESAACEWDGLTPVEFPPFGSSTDDYNAVVKAFYSVWSAFSTRKSFSWKDRYRLTEAPDRRIRRLMEKENKKLRDEATREFNDAVRSLVAFVKKRDPRYVPNTQSEAERQKILRDSATAQAARSRAANQERLADYVVPDWAQPRDGDDQHNGEFSLSEGESEVEHIECIVCDKTFKSEKQFEAHEKSKKHVKAVQQLRRNLREENASLSLEGDVRDSSGYDTPPPKNAGGGRGGAKCRQNGKGKSQAAADDSYDHDRSTLNDPNGPAEVAGSDEQTVHSSDSDSLDEDGDYAPREKIQSRISGVTKEVGDGVEKETGNAGESAAPSNNKLANQEAHMPAVGDISLEESLASKKVGMARLKRKKRAARQAPNPGTAETCTICKESFPSRTKLFAHIKDEHQAPRNVKGGKESKR